MIQFNKNTWEMQIQVTLCCKGMKPHMHLNKQLVISYMISINDPFGIPNMQPFRVRTVDRFTFAKLEAGMSEKTCQPHRAAWWHHELTGREATAESFATDNRHVSICHPQTALRLAYLACLWRTSLDVAGKLAGWRKSVQFAVGSVQERPIQAHTYIGLDWRGGTSSSVPVYMAASKNCIQVSYVLVIMPATHVDPTNTSTGQKRRVCRKTAETNKRARRGV